MNPTPHTTPLHITPHAALRGTMRVPGDKSISHRALLLGALSSGRSDIQGFLPAADCLATLRCLRDLGVRIDEITETHLVVHGTGLSGWTEAADVLDCGGSGTTMRLLAGILASLPFYAVLTGSALLRKRPMARVVNPLREMGAQIWGRDGDRLPPLSIRGGSLHGIDCTLPVASAQVKSAILLAGLQADSPTTVREPGPARDHTERMLKARGAALHTAGDGVIRLEPGAALTAVDALVPGDISSAAFFIIAACLVPDSELRIEDVGINPTRTGILDALRDMGADIALDRVREIGGEPVADIIVRSSPLRGIAIGGETIPRLIDELPVLVLAAACAQGTTVIRDAAELRVKETNRIETTTTELRKLGARVAGQPDGFIIEGPARLHGTTVDSHGDHRLAMTLAIAGLLATGETVVTDTACMDDSYPQFEATLAAVCAGTV